MLDVRATGSTKHEELFNKLADAQQTDYWQLASFNTRIQQYINITAGSWAKLSRHRDSDREHVKCYSCRTTMWPTVDIPAVSMSAV